MTISPLVTNAREVLLAFAKRISTGPLSMHHALLAGIAALDAGPYGHLATEYRRTLDAHTEGWFGHAYEVSTLLDALDARDRSSAPDTDAAVPADVATPPRKSPAAYGKWICLDWYDGPLSEIAMVTFDDDRKLVEIKCQGGWVGEDFMVGQNGEKFYVNHMRFDRETLVAMLDLIDSKPVKDFHDA